MAHKKDGHYDKENLRIAIVLFVFMAVAFATGGSAGFFIRGCSIKADNSTSGDSSIEQGFERLDTLNSEATGITEKLISETERNAEYNQSAIESSRRAGDGLQEVIDEVESVINRSRGGNSSNDNTMASEEETD
jgi:hypothetical protein